MFIVSLSVATTIVLVIAVTLLMAETLNQLVVFQQLQVPVVYHVLHAVYLGIQAAPFVDEFRETVVFAPNGVVEHAAKEGHFKGLLLYHREELCRVMYPFYFYCLLSEGEPSANNMDIKKAQAQSIL